MKAEVEFVLQMDREVMDSNRERFIPEEVITDASGKQRWLQTIKRPIIGKDGQAYQVLGVSTDITERKKAEETLRESEQRFRTIYDQAYQYTYASIIFTLLGFS
jgi:PAS domain-containing protein